MQSTRSEFVKLSTDPKCKYESPCNWMCRAWRERRKIWVFLLNDCVLFNSCNIWHEWCGQCDAGCREISKTKEFFSFDDALRRNLIRQFSIFDGALQYRQSSSIFFFLFLSCALCTTINYDMYAMCLPNKLYHLAIQCQKCERFNFSYIFCMWYLWTSENRMVHKLNRIDWQSTFGCVCVCVPANFAWSKVPFQWIFRIYIFI